MSGEKIAETKKMLEKDGIFWYPVNWKAGNSVAGKLRSFFSVFYNGFKAHLKHRPKLIHSRSSLPLFLALALHKVGRSKFLYDADSILSEEYADVKHLDRDSLGFKLMAWGEAAARRSADRIIVLTETLKKDFVAQYAVKKDIEVIPCCVDTAKFAFSEKHRAAKRAELNLHDELLFVYVGKSGTWYLVEEMIEFFQTALSKNASVKLLIVTQESPDFFENLLAKKNIKKESYFIRRADHAEVTEWLSAADVGLAFIKPLPSKRGTSPVKTSEYLANGLPILSGAGVGDLDALIEDNKVGVIVPQFTSECYSKAFDRMNLLLTSGDLRERCSRTAYQEFDLYRVGGNNYSEIYKDILQN